MLKMESTNLLKLRKLLQLYQLYKTTRAGVMKKKRLWSREWLLRRNKMRLGACEFLQKELAIEDAESFQNYVRMSKEEFETLHSLVEDTIKKEDTQFRQSISSRHRLIITLRFLATGETFKSLSYSTRISISAISTIIPEVRQAIYNTLKNQYLKTPSTKDERKNVAFNFNMQWNVPNTIGAIDGKHIIFRAPRSSGSHYYNYKGSHSIVLLAIADANYKFLYIDVGTNGRVSDGGVFDGCDFNVALNSQTLNLPDDEPLPGMEEPSVPYVLLADAAFPLQKHIMKPYPFKNMSKEDRIFNYRLSRGRRVVENAFGILANKFRIFLTPINLNRDKVVLITQACCVLHNFLRENNINSTFTTTNEQRNIETELHSAVFTRGRANNAVLQIRETFKHYFNTVGSVEWQLNMA